MAEYELFIEVESGHVEVATQGGIGSGARNYSLAELREVEGKEIAVNLRDPQTMEGFQAKVIVSPRPETLPGADTLWLICNQGRLPGEKAWAIKIIERIEEEEREVVVLSKRKLSLGERKGHMLMDLLKEREAKEKQDKMKT